MLVYLIHVRDPRRFERCGSVGGRMRCSTMCLKPRASNAYGFSKPQKVHVNSR